MVNQKYLDKAEVLIEALPYIQRFNRKIVVIKYGGSAMLDEELKRNVIKDAVLLKLVGFKPIIVHGGGKEISKWVSKTGGNPQFINGLRVTDEPTMEIAEMVLNKVNKSLVALIEELGVKACLHQKCIFQFFQHHRMSETSKNIHISIYILYLTPPLFSKHI